ncbi:MAG: PHP domain-containing protein [Coriobacteriia bacterium]|nr:PHP domain-containing protein [Coriobacteriia bacterium]
MKADLHTHSTASDGMLTPRELVELAASSGLTHLALTDHDSVDGLDEASASAKNLGVVLIPGVELSATSPDGSDVHILGFFVDRTNAPFRSELRDLRAARLRRAALMTEALSAAGLTISLNDVLHHAGSGAVGRSHVARAIVTAGHARSVHDAFLHLIGRGRPYYVAKEAHSPEEAIRCIRSAGGIPVIAHPGVGGLGNLIEGLAAHGLAGVEAYHADHLPEVRREFAEQATRLGLLVTGGSDFHSLNGPNPALGSVDLPEEALRRLLAASGR